MLVKSGAALAGAVEIWKLKVMAASRAVRMGVRCIFMAWCSRGLRAGLGRKLGGRRIGSAGRERSFVGCSSADFMNPGHPAKRIPPSVIQSGVSWESRLSLPSPKLDETGIMYSSCGKSNMNLLMLLGSKCVQETCFRLGSLFRGKGLPDFEEFMPPSSHKLPDQTRRGRFQAHTAELSSTAFLVNPAKTLESS